MLLGEDLRKTAAAVPEHAQTPPLKCLKFVLRRRKAWLLLAGNCMQALGIQLKQMPGIFLRLGGGAAALKADS